MSDPANPTTPPPVARTPRWLRPLLLAALAALLAASVAVSTDQTLTRRWNAIPPGTASARGLPRPLPPWGVTGGAYNDLYLHLPVLFVDHPVAAVASGVALTHLYILLPLALLGTLFCARLGVERGRAPEAGILPAMLCVGTLLLIVGSLGSLAPSWPVFTDSTQPDGTSAILLNGPLPAAAPWNVFMLVTLLLAAFAVVRAGPPTSGWAGFVWTVVAGFGGGLCVWMEMFAVAQVAALGLYAGWSAGWRRAVGFALGAAISSGGLYGWYVWRWGRADTPPEFSGAGWVLAPKFSAVLFLATALTSYGVNRWLPGDVPATAEPTTPTDPAVAPMPVALPPASAHRIIGFLIFVGFMSAPMAIFVLPRFAGAVYGWQFFALPLVLAAGLALISRMERQAPMRTGHASTDVR